MHAVAACLEAFLEAGPARNMQTALIALPIARLMADELELLITEVDDDHVMPVPAATVANQKAVRR